ncbi:hypothetical protein SAICODRAFT_27097 [Saitoella complicata NRRL Y-17804]|uniref:Uncharacterized protein n=1 Tax=Saitoella complicata (strain BCRC 22490 / CBS 7301 / JCM 7358 / NBRC 10748 / NRRL Y-17804) TaxID=698492 RepID=A0A0E9NJL2_SAICN|nr:uncharacterized protein SAICODRAFT_27097 [Saitoella complicata NRRL Y-17804]ODQ51038.1 hypothetical protein SAICODRAFT_27097 [Saitoella complicata NRRL Y-17804]GAO49595.1 hypothetical protein G7K_3744-t1 [Saitoella complicata NRRL Y-17804]
MKSPLSLLYLAIASASAVAAKSAHVYNFPFSSRSQHAPSLTAPEARAVLSHELQVSQFHKGLEMQIDALAFVSGEEGLWQEKKGGVVVTIAGVRDHKAIFPDTHPTYNIADSPTHEAFGDLMTRFISQSASSRAESAERIYVNTDGSSIFVIPSGSSIASHIKATADLTTFASKFGKKAAKHFDISKKEHRMFISEMLALESYIAASPLLEADARTFVQLNSLEGLLFRHSSDKHHKIYKEATHILASLVSQLTSTSTRSTILLLPPAPTQSSSFLTRRAESAFAFGEGHVASSLDFPTFQSIISFPTRLTCENATNSCSSHGSCQPYRGRADDWRCACGVTKSNNGLKTTKWAGEWCEKKDIVLPFWIFFFFGLGMVITVGWAVGLLISVGNEDLGGALMSSARVKKD